MLFLSAADQSAIGPSLIQKAFAKLCGDYFKANHQNFEVCWRALTGCPITKLQSRAEDLFEKLQEAVRRGC